MHTAIITGPTGAIGTALIQYFIEKEVEVFALVRPDSKRIRQIPQHPLVHIIVCELSKIANCELQINNLSGSAFYHLGWAGTFGDCRNDMYLQNDNIKYTLDAVNLAKRLKCKAFIFAGSQAEYGRVNCKLSPTTPTFPENGYGMAKLCAGLMSKQLCEKLEIRFCHTRILSVYGKNDGENTMINSTIRKMILNEPTFFTPCEQMWDYLYAKDAAKALYLIGKNGKNGTIYCLGSGIAHPLRYYIETIRDMISPDSKLGIGAIPYSDKQVMMLCADISNLQRDTGFTPDYTFEQGIQESIEYEKHLLSNSEK